MSIRDAVRISMSIPLYYKPLYIDDAGTVCSPSEENKNIHLMVDGGVLSNYPIQMFDSLKYYKADTLNMFFENPETIGILLERSDQIQHNITNPGVAPMRITKFNQFSSALYFTLVDRVNPELYATHKYKRTISIDNLNLSPRIRKLDPEIIDALIKSGRSGARSFFTIN